MSDSKPLASLSPQLLARKGGARPAMRPALPSLAMQSLDFDQDDLGWNDMGDVAFSPEAPVRPQLSPVPQAEPVVQAETMPQVVPLVPVAAVPPVVQQQRELARRVKMERRPAAASGRRAAFTLRIDPDRHLRLKLACTIKGRSAQALVTEALDRLLSEIPDAAEFASKLANARN